MQAIEAVTRRICEPSAAMARELFGSTAKVVGIRQSATSAVVPGRARGVRRAISRPPLPRCRCFERRSGRARAQMRVELLGYVLSCVVYSLVGVGLCTLCEGSLP